jgi:hypothetical protein
MNTYHWKEKLVERNVTYTLDMSGQLIVIENVPARVNTETGEQLFGNSAKLTLREYGLCAILCNSERVLNVFCAVPSVSKSEFCSIALFAPDTVERLQKMVWQQSKPKRVMQVPVYEYA